MLKTADEVVAGLKLERLLFGEIVLLVSAQADLGAARIDTGWRDVSAN